MMKVSRLVLISLAILSSTSHAFQNTMKRSFGRSFTTLRMAVNGDSQVTAKTVTSLDPVPDNAHRLVLMRHGESEFNNANVFTGWSDIGLTKRGQVEAEEAGQVFASHGLTFRKCYSSVLTRAIVTAHRSLEAAGVSYTPLEYDWRLNERHYGALQGLSKERTAERLGRSLVMQWRRSYEARPPLMTREHPHHDSIAYDDRYKNLTDIPLGESLQECQVRVISAWKDILSDISSAGLGESSYSLLVAHANTLRALVMHIDDIPGNEIEGLNIPTGIPFYYDIHKETGEILSSSTTTEEVGLGRFAGIYIADERKKRSFLERRRAANDPYLWALRDDQVARHMLLDDGTLDEGIREGLNGIEEEAARNTELFSPTSMKQGRKKESADDNQLSQIKSQL